MIRESQHFGIMYALLVIDDTCDVRFIYNSPEFTIVSSRKAHCFAVIANEDYGFWQLKELFTLGVAYSW